MSPELPTRRALSAALEQEKARNRSLITCTEYCGNDDLKAEVIFRKALGEDHLGQAIMNRLSKAAGYKIVRV